MYVCMCTIYSCFSCNFKKCGKSLTNLLTIRIVVRAKRWYKMIYVVIYRWIHLYTLFQLN